MSVIHRRRILTAVVAIILSGILWRHTMREPAECTLPDIHSVVIVADVAIEGAGPLFGVRRAIRFVRLDGTTVGRLEMSEIPTGIAVASSAHFMILVGPTSSSLATGRSPLIHDGQRRRAGPGARCPLLLTSGNAAFVEMSYSAGRRVARLMELTRDGPTEPVSLPGGLAMMTNFDCPSSSENGLLAWRDSSDLIRVGKVSTWDDVRISSQVAGHQFQVSHSGRKIAVTTDDGPLQIHVLKDDDLETGKRVDSFHGDDTLLGWSPNDEFVLLYSRGSNAGFTAIGTTDECRHKLPIAATTIPSWAAWITEADAGRILADSHH